MNARARMEQCRDSSSWDRQPLNVGENQLHKISNKEPIMPISYNVLNIFKRQGIERGVLGSSSNEDNLLHYN